ncbi:MAG: DUF5723 family protein [Candidatus Neomarinimicrobiota bacterium]
MKTLAKALLILSFFLPLLAQEEPEKKPDQFLNDLVKTLKSGNEVSTDNAEQKTAELPKPATLLGVDKKEEEPKMLSIPDPAKPESEDSSLLPEKDLVIPAPETTAKAKKVKKVKEAKPKKEKETKVLASYIEEPDPKTGKQKKYIAKLEKKQQTRMRLLTLDNADIVHSRTNRALRNGLNNPANLGLRSEHPSSLAIIPFNNIDIDLKTSVKPFLFMQDFLSSDELMTSEREDSMLAALGENGLELPLDINIPTLLGIKLNLLGGSIYANAGLFVQERMRIPNEFWGLILDGATISEPFTMTEEMGININAYTKLSAGYASYYELPTFLGELRFGASLNAYAGVFSGINITNLSLIPAAENTRFEGNIEILSFMDTLTVFSPGDELNIDPDFNIEDDYLNIAKMQMGLDLGVAWRIKLNRIIPVLPNMLKNYIDIQLGFEDIGAKIKMNHAYLREVKFEAQAGDILKLFNSDEEFDINSLTVLEENLLEDDTTYTKALGTKFHIAGQYQPISQIMLKGSFATYISEGINSNSGPNYSYGLEVFPVPAFSIHGSVHQKGQYQYSEAGLRLQGLGSEIGLTLRLYDLPFSFTENINGLGLKLHWARFF